MKSLQDIEDELDYQDQQKASNSFEFFAITAAVLFLGLCVGVVLCFVIG
jgi:hypothetical protein